MTGEFPRDKVDQDLDVVIRELGALPEYVEDWEAGDAAAIDALDAYETEWASVAGGRMGRLERALRCGAMSPRQEERYARARALFEQRTPLIERYDLSRPAVPLDAESDGGGRGGVRSRHGSR